jgi:hypothetical protein
MPKQTIINLLKLIERHRIEDLVRFLCESDFFQAPCSTKHHLAKPGGLAEHSLHVYTLLAEKVKRFNIDVPHESVILCGLCHDLCKINFYKEGGEQCSDAQYNYLCSLWGQKKHLVKDYSSIANLFDVTPAGSQFKRSVPAAAATLLIEWLKNKPTEPTPELPAAYSVDDKLPLGHGERSLSILQDFIKLTDIEKLAIRWHMGPWDISDYSGSWAFNNAMAAAPFIALLITADFEAGNILERESDH